jgi:putative addiction module antidote
MKLKLRKVGRNALGIALPDKLVNELGLAEGDALQIVLTPDGLALKRLDPDVERALEISDDAIRKYPNAMKRLASR